MWQLISVEINILLKRAKPPKNNISREEKKAFKELREDQDRMVLMADKGVAMVVMDRREYQDKVEGLLATTAYRTISTGPTNKLKAQLIQKLRRIKRETSMDEGMYRTMYPTHCTAPKFYGLPKIHKTGTPLRSIVSSRGTVTYGVAKIIAKVLKPLVGQSPHHIQSTSDFVSKIREVTFLPGEWLSSYNVTALFTFVPIDPALNIIKDLLEKDETLSNRSVLSVQNIIELLGFCLHYIYFSFQNMFYEQVEGAAIGSLVSPIVANLYMEHFEGEALKSASHPPRYWYRFVDDTRVIQQQAHKQLFLDHINSIDPCIKFTVHGNQENGAIPFLDTFIKPEADSSLSIRVYCKPTHTGQYLQWDSHHNQSAKYSVIGTLTHRAKSVCTTPGLLNKEL